MNQLGKTMQRVAAGALAVWMVPLVAAQFVKDWHWSVGAFVRVYVLFFLTGMVFALVAKKMQAWSYKAGVGVALVAGFALGWSNMVHVADSHNPANLWYYSVLVVGFVGACLARLKAPGLARTLFVMAATLALIAVMLPSGAPRYLARSLRPIREEYLDRSPSKQGTLPRNPFFPYGLTSAEHFIYWEHSDH